VAFGDGGFFDVGVAGEFSVEVVKFSGSDGLDFSVGSVVVVGVSDHSGLGSIALFFTLQLRGIRNVSHEGPHGASNGNRLGFHKPNHVLFAGRESKRSPVLVVVKRRRGIVLVVVIHKFHYMEILAQQVVSFSKQRIRQIQYIHLFKTLYDGSRLFFINNRNHCLRFKISLNSPMNHLQLAIVFSSIDGVFSRSMNKHFADLILGSINIS